MALLKKVTGNTLKLIVAQKRVDCLKTLNVEDWTVIHSFENGCYGTKCVVLDPQDIDTIIER